ncbi:MAG: LolA family protein [Syntrophomonadaceae bacterium]|jgi:outer membrane lipoprotein-sorting protein
MKRCSLLFMVLVLGFSLLALTGCGQEKAANAPVSPEQQEQAKSKDGGPDDLESIFNLAAGNKDMSCDIISTINEQGTTMVSKSKIWTSNGKYRVETEVNGVKTIVITNDKGETMFYDPANNTVMKMPAAQNDVKPPADWSKDAGKYKVVGTEKRDGYDCVVITTVDNAENTKMWVVKKTGLPVRVESAPANGTAVVIEYKNYKFGSQPDDLFTVPAGAQVITMPSLPTGNMPAGQ